MKVQRTQEQSNTKASCRNTLRAAINRATKRRNWVQVGLCTFGMAGLATNISATATGVVKAMTLAATGFLGVAKLVFLFYWLAAQVVIWLIAVGVFGRLISGRALTIREATDDLLTRA